MVKSGDQDTMRCRAYYLSEPGKWVFCIEMCRKNYNELVTVVGNLVDVNVGSVLLIDGNWKVDAKYGRQFLAESWEETMPATVLALKNILVPV